MADIVHETLAYEGADGPIQAYLARPNVPGTRPAVIVIHEIWGLSPHIMDVADRFAREGYIVFAPNLFSRPGLAEAMIPENIRETMQFMNAVGRERLGDRTYVQEELAKLPAERRDKVQRTLPVMAGGMPRDRLVEDLVNAVDYLNAQPFVERGKVASVGFCFGGGMSINLACHAPLSACVIFYGENPNPVEQVQNITCPVMGLYGADDMRINSHLDELVGAMVEYRKNFEMKIYPGAAHAFFNDTNQNGYRLAAAADAWQRVLRFYQQAFANQS